MYQNISTYLLLLMRRLLIIVMRSIINKEINVDIYQEVAEYLFSNTKSKF